MWYKWNINRERKLEFRFWSKFKQTLSVIALGIILFSFEINGFWNVKEEMFDMLQVQTYRQIVLKRPFKVPRKARSVT